jgi:hypothetical protein
MICWVILKYQNSPSEEFSWAQNENNIFLLALTAKAGQRMILDGRLNHRLILFSLFHSLKF